MKHTNFTLGGFCRGVYVRRVFVPEPNYKDPLRSSCLDPYQRYSRRGEGGPYDHSYSVGSAGENVHYPQCPFGRNKWDWSSETCVQIYVHEDH